MKLFKKIFKKKDSKIDPFVVVGNCPIRPSLTDCQEKIADCLGKSHYYEIYKKHEENYWSHIPQWIDELKECKEVIDIGAAYCTLAIYCKLTKNSNVTCIDTLGSYCPMSLLDDLGIKFLQQNIELDFIDGTYDLIIFTEVLEHLNFSPYPTMEKIRKLLKDGGMLVLSTPDAKDWGRTTKYYNSIKELPYPFKAEKWIDDHVWQYNVEELLDLVDKSGFKVKKFEYSKGSVGRHFNLALMKS